MASRPVFVVDNLSMVRTVDTEFVYHNGLSRTQRMRSAKSLHEAFLRRHPTKRLLEVSRFSSEELGIRLSAFNITLTLADGRKVSVETAYQAGKVFEQGGPYTDLLNGSSAEAKKDPRLARSGRIIGFELDGRSFPNSPVRLFYTWLYLKALNEDKDMLASLSCYDAFSDIVFNPKKSLNCQAFACALCVALQRRGQLERALDDLAFLAEILR